MNTRFQKGRAPWNKGLKGVYKGNLPHTTKYHLKISWQKILDEFMIIKKSNLVKTSNSEKMKIYLSGSISNNANYKQEFKDAENYLNNHYKSAIVINPVKIAEALELVKKNPTYSDYLLEGLKELSRCTHIYLHHGWQESKGAVTEYYLAKALNLKFLFEEV